MKPLSKEAVAIIEKRIADGEPYAEIGRSLSISGQTVRQIARGAHFHQQTAEEQARRNCSALGSYVPTPEEIAAHCERFLRMSPRRPVGYMAFQWHGPLFPG